jgi:tripartite-type tricarboxylate transporter receptor subunit TctC
MNAGIQTVLRYLLAALLALAAGGAVAQAWPAKPVRVIVPWPSGGPAEALSRTVLAKVTEVLGQQFLIEARPGANGEIGTAMVVKAAPDGYTILMSHLGPTAISPALKTDLPYDPLKDLEPITQIIAGPTLLVVRNGLPIHSVKELIAYAKANPGKLSYASVGVASTTHLAGEMLNVLAGINTLHVPYKGSTPAITDMMGERVDFAFFGISGSMQQARAGQIRMLGISTLKRSPNFPDIPAVAETVPGFELNSWYGYMAPAGTPKAIVNRLQQEVAAAVKKPDVMEWMKQNGLDAVASTPEEYAAFIRAELVKYAKAVKDARVSTSK